VAVPRILLKYRRWQRRRTAESGIPGETIYARYVIRANPIRMAVPVRAWLSDQEDEGVSGRARSERSFTSVTAL